MHLLKLSTLISTVIFILAGCVTTETLPDGSTKVRITNNPNAATGAVSSNITPGANNITDANGVVSLIPVDSPNKPRGDYPLYIGGRFTYECMIELLYAAKSGNSVQKTRNESCRQEYLIRQKELKQAGKPYDSKAPIFGVNPTADAAYWQLLVDETLTILRGAKQFQIRFAKMIKVSNTGQLTVRPSVGDDVNNNYVVLRTVPANVPVILDNTAFSNKISNNLNYRKTGFGEWISCTATIDFMNTIDHQTGYNYGRYEVQFHTSQMGCKEAK